MGATQSKATNTYLPKTVQGIWLKLYLGIDGRSRLPGRRPACLRHLFVAWNVNEREEPAIEADLLDRACWTEWINKVRKQLLILHADNGNAIWIAAWMSLARFYRSCGYGSKTTTHTKNPCSGQ